MLPHSLVHGLIYYPRNCPDTWLIPLSSSHSLPWRVVSLSPENILHHRHLHIFSAFFYIHTSGNETIALYTIPLGRLSQFYGLKLHPRCVYNQYFFATNVRIKSNTVPLRSSRLHPASLAATIGHRSLTYISNFFFCCVFLLHLVDRFIIPVIIKKNV